MGDFEALGLFAPELLAAHHRVDEFNSGKPNLDQWLRGAALINQRENYTRTFVVTDADGQVAAYYALCAGALMRRDAPRSIAPHGAPGEVPVALLARLAVSVDLQGRGLGKVLLRHALLSALAASNAVALRGVVVDALDDEAAAFYLAVGFKPTRADPLRLVLAMADIQKSWAAHRAAANG